MTSHTERLLRANYDAFATGNAQPLLDSLADDIQWIVSGPSPLAGKYQGKTEVLGFFGKMMDLYRGTLRVEVLDIVGNDRRGVVLTREEAQYDGEKIEFRSVHVWDLREGKLAQFSVFYSDAYHEYWSARVGRPHSRL